MKNTGENYSWQGMLVITLFIIIGVGVIYYTWGGVEITYENIYNYISNSGFVLIFSLFFIIIGIYGWAIFFRNVVAITEEQVVYLKDIDGHMISFIDKKGKLYIHTLLEDKKLDVGHYYKVEKTNDVIKRIIDESSETFPNPKEKPSYWLNLYSPYGNFENMLLIPILYVVFIPGLLSFIMSDGFSKIYGLLFMAFPGYFIVYDYIYKRKKNKIVSEIDASCDIKDKHQRIRNIDDEPELMALQTRSVETMNILPAIMQIVGGLIFLGVCIAIIINISETFVRVMLTPFIICALAIVFDGISTLRGRKTSIDYNKIYIIAFLIFWFGFLVFWGYTAINDNNKEMLYVSIPFWLAGFFMIYTKLIKKK